MLSSPHFYAVHADAIGAPSGSLIASSDAAFAALLVSSRFTHAPEAGCANGRLQCKPVKLL
jgi:hypothetical protein